MRERKDLGVCLQLRIYDAFEFDVDHVFRYGVKDGLEDWELDDLFNRFMVEGHEVKKLQWLRAIMALRETMAGVLIYHMELTSPIDYRTDRVQEDKMRKKATYASEYASAYQSSSRILSIDRVNPYRSRMERFEKRLEAIISRIVSMAEPGEKKLIVRATGMEYQFFDYKEVLVTGISSHFHRQNPNTHYPDLRKLRIKANETSDKTSRQR